MTYEERKQKVCEQCANRVACGYLGRDLQDKCTYLQNIMEGWELGHQDAVTKVCEWLKALNNEHEIMSYTDSHTLDTDELIQGFKNFTED